MPVDIRNHAAIIADINSAEPGAANVTVHYYWSTGFRSQYCSIKVFFLNDRNY